MVIDRGERPMQKLHPCLWFDDRIEEAANFYAEVFGGKVAGIDRSPADAPGLSAGSVITAHIDILGQRFMLLNGGPQFKFNESVSFVVNTKDQAETDHYWTSLISGGGEESMCGWLKDKFGVSWQITPTRLGELMGGSDKAGAKRAMEAMLKMRKLV